MTVRTTPVSEHILTALYVAWSAASIGITLANDGLTPDNITHVAILAYLAASAFALPWLRRLASRNSPQVVFFCACLISAAVVETCYMVSAPLHPSLLVNAGTGAVDAFRNLGVDLALTFPAYLLIFATIWIFIRRYDFRPVEFAVLTGAGQAIGDGMSYLLANPMMFIFLPYLMLNYHAMTLIPYLAVRDRVVDVGMRRGPALFVLPLIVLPIVYGIAGTTIVFLGRALGWID